jgi:replication factor C subunit 1
MHAYYGIENSANLWTDKFSPRVLADLVGNSSAIATLRTWLSNWPGNQATGKASKVSTRKAILISGAPGIGKTTSAILICRELGFQTLNVNASDSRGKTGAVSDGIAGTLASTVREFVTNRNIGIDGLRSTKTALIMDEVDGMAGGDRGGISELIEVIKHTRIPIICICNDRYSQKLKTLANYCVDLPFQRPNKLQLRKYLNQIVASQRLDVDSDAVDALIEANNNDLRSSINQLQLWGMSSKHHGRNEISKKDVATSVFQAIDVLFRPSPLKTLDERLNLVFQHSDMIPLFVQENYACMRPRDSTNELQRIVHVAAASSRVAEGDVFATTINKTQNWTMMPPANIVSCVLPTSAVRGSRETFGQAERHTHRFPSLLGKLSSKSKSQRLLSELYQHFRSSGRSCSTQLEFCLWYASLTKRLLTRPLFSQARGGKELDGIPDVLNLMQTYNFTRGDWANIQEITGLSGKGPTFENPNTQIPTNVKSTFTRSCKRELQFSD